MTYGSVVRKALVVAVLVTGITVGTLATDSKKVIQAQWKGKPPREAASYLLDVATAQAGKGSWERIAVARIHYLSGDRSKGQPILEEYLGAKGEVSDLIRIARIYVEAKEWDKARAVYERVIQRDPRDAPKLSEFGALLYVNGERERGEEMFQRAFDESPDDVFVTAAAGGALLGLPPQLY